MGCGRGRRPEKGKEENNKMGRHAVRFPRLRCFPRSKSDWEGGGDCVGSEFGVWREGVRVAGGVGGLSKKGRRSWLQDTLKRKLVDFAWNRRFFCLPG